MGVYWDQKGIIVPQKGQRLNAQLLRLMLSILHYPSNIQYNHSLGSLRGFISPTLAIMATKVAILIMLKVVLLPVAIRIKLTSSPYNPKP